ncbi:uncharacterized protein LOC125199319 [Salvia hispanica]|uniref:uncharacterized protein LOC125199319 n=1 Tax=Salvia hispanica TaxID=49212 RepID=UPI0020096F67|nr:uncharacterized protein LOC125199319 [Salvia hispanica]
MAENPNLPIGETTSLESDVTEIDSGMAKEAKKTREVSEFTDFFGLLRIYQKEMIFEREDYDPMVDYSPSDYDDEELKEMEEYPYDREAVLKYITQVRNSGGFDVDVYIPAWLHMNLVNFMPVEMSDPGERALMYKLAKVAIDEINVDMKSKTFELVEVVNAVATANCIALAYLTLAVKRVGVKQEEAATITIQAIVNFHWDSPFDLRQWRVKPDAEARAVEG